jgi:hypothetical protein
MAPFELLPVTCTYEKADGPRATKDLYPARYFERLRRYAERHARPWYIVSAEHGLVLAGSTVELHLAGAGAGADVRVAPDGAA